MKFSQVIVLNMMAILKDSVEEDTGTFLIPKSASVATKILNPFF